AREQAASCQKVIGGWANIAKEYDTKRYRSNLINRGMLPFVIDKDFDFDNDYYVFIPGVKDQVKNKTEVIKSYVVKK
ncbi:hydratase, partial [Coprococcus eutactus]|nr:hydratase [Coprococcus eutactus]